MVLKLLEVPYICSSTYSGKKLSTIVLQSHPSVGHHDFHLMIVRRACRWMPVPQFGLHQKIAMSGPVTV